MTAIHIPWVEAGVPNARFAVAGEIIPRAGLSKNGRGDPISRLGGMLAKRAQRDRKHVRGTACHAHASVGMTSGCCVQDSSIAVAANNNYNDALPVLRQRFFLLCVWFGARRRACKPTG